MVVFIMTFLADGSMEARFLNDSIFDFMKAEDLLNRFFKEEVCWFGSFDVNCSNEEGAYRHV